MAAKRRRIVEDFQLVPPKYLNCVTGVFKWEIPDFEDQYRHLVDSERNCPCCRQHLRKDFKVKVDGKDETFHLVLKDDNEDEDEWDGLDCGYFCGGSSDEDWDSDETLEMLDDSAEIEEAMEEREERRRRRAEKKRYTVDPEKLINIFVHRCSPPWDCLKSVVVVDTKKLDANRQLTRSCFQLDSSRGATQKCFGDLSVKLDGSLTVYIYYCLQVEDNDDNVLGMGIRRSEMEKYSDFTLICGGREFKVHKVILAANSYYFAGMFRSGDWVENKKNTTRLKGVRPEAVDAVLSVMYTQKMKDAKKLSLKETEDILKVADMILFMQLKEFCEELLLNLKKEE